MVSINPLNAMKNNSQVKNKSDQKLFFSKYLLALWNHLKTNNNKKLSDVDYDDDNFYNKRIEFISC